MAITTLCAVVAVLRVLPNRAQFFLHESVSLSCELQGNSSVWTVKRNTTDINEKCSTSWDRRNGSHCLIEDLYPSDTAAYWCESAAGEKSPAVSITVTDGSVILDSPALPVMEGDDVTLRCNSSETSSTDFYKDGLLIGSSSTGNMTIVGVSKSDEGVYKCNVSGAESPDSRLTVRGKTSEPLRRSSLFSSVAEYRPHPDGCIYTPSPVLTYKA
ncbi:hypothetical protein L3Q82_003789 [Scortum barcoo]|uniref:Uncharacterized protein n=1 Tax=Scortum barcoo TaxID=214431 RepID=A0ACB8X5A4_9TELE|nr:hypothetical protein L3Q82_003789 [Scortum barcoo]